MHVPYLAEQIEAKMRFYTDQGYRISTIYNPFWKVSNNLLSLWLARNVIEHDDVMITNGDNIFSAPIFAGLASQKEGIWLSACRKQKFDNDDMKIHFEEGFVAEVSKTIAAGCAEAESPGLVMVNGLRARQLFLEHLEGVVRDDNNNRYWLEIFNRMWSKGVPVKPWFFTSAGNWQEVDFHVDVDFVKKILADKVKRVAVEVV